MSYGLEFWDWDFDAVAADSRRHLVSQSDALGTRNYWFDFQFDKVALFLICS